MSRRVLITGDSIVGAASAFWLARIGCEVVVQEAAPAPRPAQLRPPSPPADDDLDVPDFLK